MAGPERVYSTAYNLNFLLVYPNWGIVTRPDAYSDSSYSSSNCLPDTKCSTSGFWTRAGAVPGRVFGPRSAAASASLRCCLVCMRCIGVPATESAPTSRGNALTSTLGSSDGCLVDILYTTQAKASLELGCNVVVTSALPVAGVGRLRVSVLVHIILCVHREGVLVGIWTMRWWVWCTGFQCCSWAVWSWQSMVGLLLVWVCHVLCRSWRCQTSVTFYVLHTTSACSLSEGGVSFYTEKVIDAWHRQGKSTTKPETSTANPIRAYKAPRLKVAFYAPALTLFLLQRSRLEGVQSMRSMLCCSLPFIACISALHLVIESITAYTLIFISCAFGYVESSNVP